MLHPVAERFVFPSMQRVGWCGEYKAKKTVQTTRKA